MKIFSKTILLVGLFFGVLFTNLLGDPFFETSYEAVDHGFQAYSVAWSPDGRYLAVGGNNGSQDVIVYEWGGSSLTISHSKHHGSLAYSVEWSSDGKYLAVGGWNGLNDVIVYEWDTATSTLNDLDSGAKKNHGEFSWFDTQEWEKELSYKKDTLTAAINAQNKALQLQLQTENTVHYKHNIYLKKITVTNNAKTEKEIKLFFHHMFKIAGSSIGNTVYYNPMLKAIIFFKGKRYFLVNGMRYEGDERHGISSYTTGVFNNQGKLGTYVDAEDGKLDNNPIEHGSVDATISFEFTVKPGESHSVYTWICAGTKNTTITKQNEYVLKYGAKTLMEKTEKHWIKWVNKTKFKFPGLSDHLVDLFKRSLLLVTTHVDKRGAFIASGDSETLHLKKRYLCLHVATRWGADCSLTRSRRIPRYNRTIFSVLLQRANQGRIYFSQI